MLRASIESLGGTVDFAGLTDGATADASPVRGAATLVGFVEAALSSEVDAAEGEEDPGRLAAARERLRTELGPSAVVDAAAIIGNFERMVRIADGTGIPLDAAVNVATESIRAELGIDRFDKAARTRDVTGWQRAIGGPSVRC